MDTKQANFSILMFPWLAHGHVFPYLELAKNLSKRSFEVFFCSTAINLSSIGEALGTTPDSVSIHLVELELPAMPDLPPERHTTKNLPPKLWPKLYRAFKMSRHNFSTIVSSLKPDILIYDLFQPWAAAVALSLGVLPVHFATSGPALYSFYHHQLLNWYSSSPFDPKYLEDNEKKDLVVMAVSDHRDLLLQAPMLVLFVMLSGGSIFMKTFRGIEGKYTDYFSGHTKIKVVPVGSLVTPAMTEQQNHSEIMQWLSTKRQRSTVFICFGSENYLSKNEMEEMAKGLEVSNVYFIWVVRFPPGERVGVDEALPKGFLEGVKERGMIVEGWAPQAAILAHPSIGAFVTHCGMSSITETIYFGVPAICIPFTYDQPLNAAMMVEAGVALKVAKDENGHFSGQEVANAISEVVFGETGEGMRLRAAQLSEKMKSEEEEETKEAAEQLRRLCTEHMQRKLASPRGFIEFLVSWACKLWFHLSIFSR